MLCDATFVSAACILPNIINMSSVWFGQKWLAWRSTKLIGLWIYKKQQQLNKKI